MKKKLLWILLLVVCLASFSALSEGNRYNEVFDASKDAGLFTIRFLWLGPQTADDKPGDSMILTSPDGKVMVLDAGHPNAVGYVTDALDAMGVTKIDYLVNSHPHIDHAGGLSTLMRKYEIGALYTSHVEYLSSSIYRDYMSTCKRKGIEHIYLSEGDSFQFGEDITVYVYNPPETIEYPENYPKNATEFLNNNSLVLKFVYGNSTVMLSGDLYYGGEMKVAKRWGEALDCDVMKANHHGADTSSSLAWRNAVTPQITFITCHTIKDYSTAKIFTRNGQKLYHTYIDGCIRMSTAGDGTYQVLTEKDRTTDLFD